MRIASVLVILLGVISILALRGILGSDTAFSGLSEEEGKSALFGLTALYVLNGFKILAGSEMVEIIINIVLLVIPYYYLHNAYYAGNMLPA